MILRTRAPLRRDTDVTYAALVAGRVDREEWAKVLLQLIAEESGGNKSAFARLIGSTYRTVLRWLNEEVDVTEAKVREIAQALNISPVGLLIRVGYYQQAELDRAGPPTPEEIAADPALRVIEASNAPPRVKAAWRARLAELRAQRAAAAAAAELDEVAFWVDQQARGA